MIRVCDACGREDELPHHVTYQPGVDPVTGQVRDMGLSKHIACCAEEGCEVCSGG
jgi:hypothetical protein